MIRWLRDSGRDTADFRSVSAAVAQLVERVLGKDEVMGSSPISSFGHGTSVDSPRNA